MEQEVVHLDKLSMALLLLLSVVVIVFVVLFFLRFLVLESFRDLCCAASHLFPISKYNLSSCTRYNQYKFP